METTMTTSIIEHFSSLSDPSPGILLKTSHKLIDIVVIALCAVISGADDWVEIQDYGIGPLVSSTEFCVQRCAVTCSTTGLPAIVTPQAVLYTV